MKTLIHTASSEIEATILKGALEGASIKAFIMPGNDTLNAHGAAKGPNTEYDVYVEEDQVAKAKEVLNSMK